MKSSYEVVPATWEHALIVGLNMRKPDVADVWACARKTPLEALQLSMRASPDPRAGLVDGRVVCIFGIGELSPLGLTGVPWLLATDAISPHARELIHESARYLAKAREQYVSLSNYVDARNIKAVKWLKWLGFVLDPSVPWGPDRLPFHRFHWEKAAA